MPVNPPGGPTLATESAGEGRTAADPAWPCAGCYHDADVEIAGLWLCYDCYHMYGSTCAGVGTQGRPAEPTC